VEVALLKPFLGVTAVLRRAARVSECRRPEEGFLFDRSGDTFRVVLVDT
jgi:hypothetical protein